MRALTSRELLELWDEASPEAPVERALMTLLKALPQLSMIQLARLPIGTRDGLLLDLRELTFGPQLLAVLRCPACDATLETHLDADDIRCGDDRMVIPSLEVSVDGNAVTVQIPTSLDLAALTGCADVAAGEQILFDRCVRVNRTGPDVAAPLTTGIRDAIDRAMSDADPQADLHLAVTCPECEHEWMAIFDIASFLWTEIRTFAGQLMLDVHTLASTYGWNEGDILAMSVGRRQRYVAMVQA